MARALSGLESGRHSRRRTKSGGALYVPRGRKLAFVAAIQQLPPRQRAVLLLCDVLGWAAAEAATLLGGSTASINSALQRAREALAKRYPDGRPAEAPRPDATQQKLLDRYLRAWEGLDLDSFVSLLKEDATYTMPPLPQWYAGRDAIRTFFGWAWKLYGGFRLVPTAANRQPAFAAYSRSGADGPWAAHSIQVLSLEQDAISRLTLFAKPTARSCFKPLDCRSSPVSKCRPLRAIPKVCQMDVA